MERVIVAFADDGADIVHEIEVLLRHESVEISKDLTHKIELWTRYWNRLGKNVEK